MSKIKKLDELREHYTRDEIIAEQGVPSEGLLLLEAGKIRFEVDGKPVGSIKLLAEERTVEFFGEVSGLLGGPTLSTAIAEEECSIIRIPVNQLEGIFKIAPSLALKLAQSLCRKLQASHLAATQKEKKAA